jgi:hypothetical protein
MERLFSPCTRYRDLAESQGHRVSSEELQELDLEVSTEEFLSAERAFTYADLYAMLENRNTFVWLTSHAYVAHSEGREVDNWWLDDACHFCFNADGKEISALAHSPEHLLGICDVVLRLLAASSAVHSVILHDWDPRNALINAPTLGYLMEQCQSLKVLSFYDLEMDESHCRVLGAYSRPDLDIVLDYCNLTSAGTTVLVGVLGRNQGPTKLDRCDIDNFVLANGLRGNSRLKSLRPRLSDNPDIGNRQVLAIASALRENKGLVDLDLEHDFRMSDETWDAVCDSLKTHPFLQVLNLRTDAFVTPAVITSRVQALLDMMNINTSIHRIHLRHRYSHHEIFRESVIPYLVTNRLRPRVRAIQKSRPIAYRAKVLGRALLAVRTDPNRFWMLLSGNAEIAYPLRTTTIDRGG